MLIMSCYSEFFNVRRGWQSLNTGPRFNVSPEGQVGCEFIHPHNRQTSLKAEETLPFLYPGRTDRWMDGRTDGRTDRWTYGETDRQTNGEKDIQMDGRIDGRRKNEWIGRFLLYIKIQ